MADAELTAAGDDAPLQRGGILRDEPLGRGNLVGRFVILGILGAGGMGVVYAAYDPELDRKVALKFLLPGQGAAHDGARTRLQREAQAMARLSHPNVIGVHDVGVHASGVYVAMEFVEGQTVAQWLAADKRSNTEIIAVFVQMGRGLAAAHAEGLLHRDVKPDNAMLDEQGRVRVLDFGLALAGEATQPSKQEREDSIVPNRRSDSHRVTRASALVGTPAYMAPEQFMGGEIDERTDQFALCVSLWEALFGERPFAGDDVLDLALAVTEGQRRPPPAGHTVPGWLRQILERGLSVNPDERWPTMDALLEALAQDPTRRRNRWLAAGAGLALLGLVGVSVQAWLSARALQCGGADDQLKEIWDDDRRAAIREAILGIDAPYAANVWERSASRLDGYAQDWIEMHTDTCEATTIRGEQSTAVMDLRMACLHGAKVELAAVTGLLATADAPVVLKAHAAVDRLRPLSRCADVEALQGEVEPPLPHEAEAVKAVRSLVAQANGERTVGRYEAAQAKVEAAKKRLSDDAVEYGPVHTDVALADGGLQKDQGRYDAAEEMLRGALHSAARWDQRHALAVAAASLITVVGFHQRRFEAGLRYRELAEGMAEGAPRDEAAVHASLGALHQAKGEYEEAARLHGLALATRERALGADHPLVAGSLTSLATVREAMGDFTEAETLHTRALAIWTNALGPNHPNVAGSLNNLAVGHRMSGEYDEAATLHKQALAIWETALGADHPNVAMVVHNLAAVHEARGNYDEAATLYERAIETWEKALGPEHPLVANSLNNLANVRRARSEYDEAARLHERALAIQKKALGPEHADVANSLNNLAALHETRGDHDEAARLYAQALAVWEKALGPEHPHLAFPLVGIAEVAIAQGRPEDAVAAAERSVQLRTTGDVPATDLALARFVLARALTAVEPGGRSERSITLAQQARDAYREAGKSSAKELAEVEAWLASRPG